MGLARGVEWEVHIATYLGMKGMKGFMTLLKRFEV